MIAGSCILRVFVGRWPYLSGIIVDIMNTQAATYRDGRMAQGLRGVDGVVLAVISQAVADLRSDAHRADALAYFSGDTYRSHLDLLGVDGDALPVALVEGGG